MSGPRCTTLPCLRIKMDNKQATVKALAKRAGVCTTTVMNAAHGKRIAIGLAACIEEALEKYQYQRSPAGARSRYENERF